MLYSFTGGADGAVTFASVIRDDEGNFYGTTTNGGNLNGCGGVGCGVVFKLNPNGKETLLHTFLLHDGQVDVARDQGEAQRVLEAMRVASVGWKPGAIRDRLESAKELRAVNPSALLRDKNKIARIAELGQPSA